MSRKTLPIPLKPACPCGSGQADENCCNRFISGNQHAPTAEALMRSRYTAYTRNNEAYLRATWHASSRPKTLDLNSQPATKWLGLNVVRHAQQDASHAIVEFVARYKIHGRAFKLHETSRFVLENGQWLYVDGDVSNHDKGTSRNNLDFWPLD